MENDNTSSLEGNDDHMGVVVPPALNLDPADYLPEMAEFDMTEAQKVELLETLWSIMRSFVEAGVDIGKADPCGQVFDGMREFPDASLDGVKFRFAKATEIPSTANGKDTLA